MCVGGEGEWGIIAFVFARISSMIPLNVTDKATKVL